MTCRFIPETKQERQPAIVLQAGQCDPLLAHIFARPVGIADLARFIALQEQELARAFIGVDFGGQGRRVENSSVTCPSQPGSSGVTLTMMPQRA